MENIGKRAKSRREELKLTQAELAKMVGVSQQSIQWLEVGKTERPRYITELAEALETSVKWLKTGEGENTLQAKTVPLRMPVPEYLNPDRIPIYGYVAGANNMSAINESHIVGWVERPYTLQGIKNPFLLIVIGDSMEPRYFQNERVHVNPGRRPNKGEHCVVEKMNGEAVIKIYKGEDETHIHLAQYNPKKPLKYHKKDVKGVYSIVGTG